MSDEFIVPVCRVHHRELHRSGNEVAWWRKLNIDPIPIALRLWQRTRTDGDQSHPKLWKNAGLDETNRFRAGKWREAALHLAGLADHPDEISACAQPTTKALRDTRDSMQRSVAATNQVSYVDSVGWFCTNTVCPMVVNGVVTHFDQWHLTADYATLLTNPLAQALRLAPT